MLPEYTIAFRTGRKRSNSGLEETLTREQVLPCTNGPPYQLPNLAARARPASGGASGGPVCLSYLRAWFRSSKSRGNEV